jgi:hypothetical protein
MSEGLAQKPGDSSPLSVQQRRDDIRRAIAFDGRWRHALRSKLYGLIAKTAEHWFRHATRAGRGAGGDRSRVRSGRGHSGARTSGVAVNALVVGA